MILTGCLPYTCICWSSSCINWFNPMVTTGLPCTLQMSKLRLKEVKKNLAQLRFKPRSAWQQPLFSVASHYATLPDGLDLFLSMTLCGTRYCLLHMEDTAIPLDHRKHCLRPPPLSYQIWVRKFTELPAFSVKERGNVSYDGKSVAFGTKWIQVCMLTPPFSNLNSSDWTSVSLHVLICEVGAHSQVVRIGVQSSAWPGMGVFSPG